MWLVLRTATVKVKKKRDVNNSRAVHTVKPAWTIVTGAEGEEEEGRERQREAETSQKVQKLTSHLISRTYCYRAFSFLPSVGGVYREYCAASRMAINNKP